MSEPSRQSYYEIALTNRQVLSVFVVLLVAVLTAFLAGAWLGKRSAQPAVETVEAQTMTATTEPAEEPLERLEFFSRGQNGSADQGAQIPPVESPPVESPPAESAEPQSPASEPPSPESPTPESSGAAQEEPSGLVAVPAASEPEPRVEEPAADPVAAAERPPPAAPGAGTLVVQVVSSSNQVQAQGVVDRLRTGGFPALLSPVEVAGRTMYRVRIGPYSDRREAERIAEQVRRDYRLDTWITE